LKHTGLYGAVYPLLLATGPILLLLVRGVSLAGLRASKTTSRQENGGERSATVPTRSSSSREDKNEGKMDRAKGRMKEAGGALTGDRSKKSEGRSDQRKGKAKEKKGAAKDLLS
jgi:uncharacterized protein YjbJ (UPF0337 family)